MLLHHKIENRNIARRTLLSSSDERYRGQSEPAPTSAPTWMDGALIGFSFLSLCHPRFTFFVCPFSALISVFFCNFIFSPPLSQFFFPLISLFFWNFIFSPAPTQFLFFCFWNFSRPLTYYPPLPPSDLLAYIFKLKVDSSPSTYSPINLECATLISTHLPTTPPPLSIYLPTCPSTFLPTNTLSRYLPNPT